jgi:hypothetical protein
MGRLLEAITGQWRLLEASTGQGRLMQAKTVEFVQKANN